MSRTSIIVIALGTLFAAAGVQADCCRVVKVDPTTPSSTVRVCEPDAAGECGALLFEGTLSLAEAQEVCTPRATIVYQEYDTTLEVFGAPVEAVCEGADVEI